MVKPTKKTGRLDYHKMIEYLEKKYNFEARGFTGIPSTVPNVDNHFYDWCKKHKLPKKDPDGLDMGSSTIYFEQYKKAEDGKKSLPPYMDFWHYLTDVNEVHNGGTIAIYRKVDTSRDLTPAKTLKMYKDLLKTTKDRATRKNLEFLIHREENTKPVVNPFEGWKQKITDLIFEEFGQYAEGDHIEVYVNW